MWRSVAFILLAALTVAGCGGSQAASPQERAALLKAYRREQAALATKDPRALCNSIAPQTVTLLRRNVGSSVAPGASCETLESFALRQGGDGGDFGNWNEAKHHLVSISVSGSTATMTFGAPRTRTFLLYFQNVPGSGWRALDEIMLATRFDIKRATGSYVR